MSEQLHNDNDNDAQTQKERESTKKEKAGFEGSLFYLILILIAI